MTISPPNIAVCSECAAALPNIPQLTAATPAENLREALRTSHNQLLSQ